MKDLNYYKDKTVHGPFIAHPKCDLCKITLTHEYLDGDYTLLICSDCFPEYTRTEEEKFAKSQIERDKCAHAFWKTALCSLPNNES